MRRPIPSRPPSIFNPHRLASTFGSPPRDPLRNPSTSLSALLQTQGLQYKGSESPKTINVIDPTTRQNVTIDLKKVKPFTQEFALLPLQYRTEIEKKYLFETLKQRQQTSYQVLSGDEDDGKVKVDPKVVERLVMGYVRNRRYKTDEPPSKAKIQLYIDMATKRAKKMENKKRQQRSVAPTLSFEEQWFRRDAYGMIFRLICLL